MLRKTIVTIALAAILLSGGLGIQKWLIANKPDPVRSDVDSRAPLVSTVLLTPADVRDVLRGFGTALADRQATLTAEVSAPVVERVDNLDAGDAVEAGQKLIRLDDRQYVAELHEAQSRLAAQDALLNQLKVEAQNNLALLEISESDLKITREEFDRVQQLFDQGHAPKTERDSTRLRYQISLRAKQQIENQVALIEPRRLQIVAERAGAEAAAELAQLNIERCLVKAPFAGVVETVSVDVGDRVQMGAQLVRLINLDRIEIPVELAVSTRVQAFVGANVDLHVESMPTVRWKGKVSRISPSADVLTRTYRVYVEVDNLDHATPLLPGYFVQAHVDGELLRQALLVPRNAIVDGHVYVANGHQAHVRQVEVLRFLEDDAVLSGDVRPGDLVIISNLDALYEKADVRLRDEEVRGDEEGLPSNASEPSPESHVSESDVSDSDVAGSGGTP
ncbi:MAG: efflux RND transporter periplasmic adaptor subunit [Planctomycetes bacterium]|nr:efflux RND transporter periplasmic adaptor subunit [Planctomycetota bacterium]